MFEARLMKKIDLGQSLTILANIGVIVGIVLLFIELRQTNNAIRGATYQAHSESVEEWDKFIAQSEILVETIARYREASYSELSASDQIRLYSLSLASFNRLQNLFRQYELGLLDDTYYDNIYRAEMEINVPRWVDTGLLESQFYRSGAPATFKAEVDKYLNGPLVK
jgi:hypothetical protein